MSERIILENEKEKPGIDRHNTYFRGIITPFIVQHSRKGERGGGWRKIYQRDDKTLEENTETITLWETPLNTSSSSIWLSNRLSPMYLCVEFEQECEAGEFWS